MEFLVTFEVTVPDGTAEAEVQRREREEAQAADELAGQGHLVRVWRQPDGPRILGLYRAQSRDQLDGLLRKLPLADWMAITVTPLAEHANDPAHAAAAAQLPDPRLTLVFRLETTLGPLVDLGDIPQGRRRIVPLTGGTFTGPNLKGTLVPGASADWQVVAPDGTAYGDIRYTLQTDSGQVLYVQSRSVRHGTPDVLARLGRGEPVDPSEYVFRGSTQIETAAAELDWLNKGVYVTVGGRRPAGVIYETYLVN